MLICQVTWPVLSNPAPAAAADVEHAFSMFLFRNIWLHCVSSRPNQHLVVVDLYSGSAYIAIFGNTHALVQTTGSATTRI